MMDNWVQTLRDMITNDGHELAEDAVLWDKVMATISDVVEAADQLDPALEKYTSAEAKNLWARLKKLQNLIENAA
jgi:hypothetical protein